MRSFDGSNPGRLNPKSAVVHSSPSYQQYFSKPEKALVYAVFHQDRLAFPDAGPKTVLARLVCGYLKVSLSPEKPFQGFQI